jgi:hypothetical protein
MEAALEYIMLNSSTFRTLPAACIAKARRYLALPETDPDQAFQNLSDADIFPIFIIPVGPPDSDGATPVRWERIIFDDSVDTLETPAKPKPGTTVVHAERVVVDNKKMIKILKFNNVYSANKVTVDYLKEPPYYIRERDISTEYILLTPSDDLLDNTVIKEGDIMSLKNFGKMIKTMKEAGARLAKINKTAKLEKEHSGKFTVSI